MTPNGVKLFSTVSAVEEPWVQPVVIGNYYPIYLPTLKGSNLIPKSPFD